MRSLKSTKWGEVKSPTFSPVDCNMAARGIIDDGTAIGDGIMNAILRLKDSEAKSKVIILLTDGVNNSGVIGPLMAADIAADMGIKVFDSEDFESLA